MSREQIKSVLALDPGPERTAWVVMRDDKPTGFGHDENAVVVGHVAGFSGDAFAVEMIASYGMPVGREVFDTCVWIGRFAQTWRLTHTGSVERMVYRAEVKTNLCHSQKANDASIRAALIDRFGPGKSKAIGVKKSPGPLYGIKGDVWAALAVAVTFADSLSTPQPTGAHTK